MLVLVLQTFERISIVRTYRLAAYERVCLLDLLLAVLLQCEKLFLPFFDLFLLR